jgi:tetratricopeptide (TPR) repeat protein
MTHTALRPAISFRAIALTGLVTASLFVMLLLGGCAAAEETSQAGDVDSARELYEQGDFDAATAELEAIVEADADDLEARRVLALAYAAQGDNEAAIEQYLFVIERDEQDHASLYRLALLERLTGDTAGAVAHFEQAIALQPDTTYLDELARTLMQTGDFENAAALWGQALDDEALAQENRVEILKLQADAYSNARMYEEAKAALERALFLAPNDEIVKARLAELDE